MEDKQIIGVSQTLAGIISNILSEGKHEMAETVLNAVTDTAVELNEMPPGTGRVKAIQGWIDEAIKDDDRAYLKDDIKVACTAGCSACCSIQVELDSEEADLIYEVTRDKGISLDRERLKEQASFSLSDYQKNFFSGKSRCALLGEDNRCRIYESRPIACRLHISVSEPSLCEPTPEGEARDHLKIGRLTAEILYSAYMQNKDGGIKKAETLPAALLRRLDNETKRTNT